MFEDIAVSAKKGCHLKGPFVYGFIDLFSGCGESWHWGLGLDENKGIVSSVKSDVADGSKLRYEALGKNIDKNVKTMTIPDTKQGPLLIPTVKLDTVKEENEYDNKSISTNDSTTSVMEELVEDGIKGKDMVSIICIVLLVFDVNFCT